MRVTLFIASKALTVIVLIAALVAVGFAHKFGRTTLTPDLAAYVATVGSLSDICGAPDGQGRAAGLDCEACRISDASIVLRNCNTIPPVVLDQTRAFSFVAKRLRNSRRLDPARLTRAPPQA